ncbi:MAG: FkbM family methyltransferase [Verrucomicrobia bacterium]|nr:FkbM family methyltransferase [Verrucomicrobiota bacterium]
MRGIYDAFAKCNISTYVHCIDSSSFCRNSKHWWANDEGVDHVDFLWLDMQGFELDMIKASELAKNARAIWMEVEFVEAYAGQYLFYDVLSWMEANGFQLAATNFNLDRPNAWSADALFVKEY